VSELHGSNRWNKLEVFVFIFAVFVALTVYGISFLSSAVHKLSTWNHNFVLFLTTVVGKGAN